MPSVRGETALLTRSSFDPSTPHGRLSLARATLLSLALTLLLKAAYGLEREYVSHSFGTLRGVLRHWQGSPQALLVSGLVVLLLLGASYRPALNLQRWLLVCAACFVAASAADIWQALHHQRLPQGINLWTPLILLQLPLLLGAAPGVMVALGWVLVASLALGFTLALDLRPLGSLLSWLSWLGSNGLFALVGYSISRFVTDIQREQAQAHQALNTAQYDALTQVLGRAATQEELARNVERAQQHRIAFSLIVCDIDHFKKVNDQHGHNKGDEVLRAVALRLRQNSLPIGAVVGRWGGEEFVIMLPRYSREDALNVAEQIRQDLEQNEVAGLHVTLSLGVAAYRRGEEVSSLFERADQATYEAKHEGRNRVKG